MKDQGFIQVYTGNRKGKTTAALGLAQEEAKHKLRFEMENNKCIFRDN